MNVLNKTVRVTGVLAMLACARLAYAEDPQKTAGLSLVTGLEEEAWKASQEFDATAFASALLENARHRAEQGQGDIQGVAELPIQPSPAPQGGESSGVYVLVIPAPALSSESNEPPNQKQGIGRATLGLLKKAVHAAEMTARGVILVPLAAVAGTAATAIINAQKNLGDVLFMEFSGTMAGLIAGTIVSIFGNFVAWDQVVVYGSSNVPAALLGFQPLIWGAVIGAAVPVLILVLDAIGQTDYKKLTNWALGRR